MEKEEYWLCRDCAGVYRIPLDTTNFSRIGTGRPHLINKLGPCPMCGEFRQLYRAEELKEEAAECLSPVQSLTQENPNTSNS